MQQKHAVKEAGTWRISISKARELMIGVLYYIKPIAEQTSVLTFTRFFLQNIGLHKLVREHSKRACGYKLSKVSCTEC